MSRFEQDLKDLERSSRFEAACEHACESYFNAVENSTNEAKIGAAREAWIRAERAYAEFCQSRW